LLTIKPCGVLLKATHEKKRAQWNERSAGGKDLARNPERESCRIGLEELVEEKKRVNHAD